VPLASTTNPLMDGAAAIGIGTTWARADHVHASDTSRAPLAGVTNGSNAAAGTIGEYISAQVTAAAALSAANGVVLNVTSISLTAGDWDVTGNAYWIVSGGSLAFDCAINSVSATNPDGSLQMVIYPTSGNNTGLTAPGRRFNVTATTVVYLVATAFLSGGTASVCGFLQARRVR
jgi:hypothetical protein